MVKHCIYLPNVEYRLISVKQLKYTGSLLVYRKEHLCQKNKQNVFD